MNVARSLFEVDVVKREAIPEHITPTGTALAEPEMVTQLNYKGQLVNVDAFPVGTNPEHILNTLGKPETQQRIQEIRQELQGRTLAISPLAGSIM